MPYHEITVVDGEFLVGTVPADIFGFWMLPPDPSLLADVVRGKAEGRLPSILRVLIYYRVEYVYPTPFTTGSGAIYVIDCEGSDQPPVTDISVSDSGPVDEGQVDVSNRFTKCGPGKCFGLNMLKVSLGPAAGPGGIPLLQTKYKVKVVVKVSWGW